MAFSCPVKAATTTPPASRVETASSGLPVSATDWMYTSSDAIIPIRRPSCTSRAAAIPLPRWPIGAGKS
jgi:hypothetical protein